jgi:hypothetical protein
MAPVALAITAGPATPGVALLLQSLDQHHLDVARDAPCLLHQRTTVPSAALPSRPCRLKVHLGP